VRHQGRGEDIAAELPRFRAIRESTGWPGPQPENLLVGRPRWMTGPSGTMTRISARFPALTGDTRLSCEHSVPRRGQNRNVPGSRVQVPAAILSRRQPTPPARTSRSPAIFKFDRSCRRPGGRGLRADADRGAGQACPHRDEALASSGVMAAVSVSSASPEKWTCCGTARCGPVRRDPGPRPPSGGRLVRFHCPGHRPRYRRAPMDAGGPGSAPGDRPSMVIRAGCGESGLVQRRSRSPG
jgi:hypothetical protein